MVSGVKNFFFFFFLKTFTNQARNTDGYQFSDIIETLETIMQQIFLRHSKIFFM